MSQIIFSFFIDLNCEILLAKDFGRTGSSISLINGKLHTQLTPKSGFDVSEDNGVIVIKASGRLFGNVAGALGTMVSYFFKLQKFN